MEFDFAFCVFALCQDTAGGGVLYAGASARSAGAAPCAATGGDRCCGRSGPARPEGRFGKLGGRRADPDWIRQPARSRRCCRAAATAARVLATASAREEPAAALLAASSARRRTAVGCSGPQEAQSSEPAQPQIGQQASARARGPTAAQAGGH